MNECAGGCGLACEPGDVFCAGCREGHERNRPVGQLEDELMSARNPGDRGDPAAR